MAVQQKDEAQPIASKLKGQESDYVDREHNDKDESLTDSTNNNKPQNNGTHTTANNNNNNSDSIDDEDDDESPVSGQDQQTSEVTEGMAAVAIAEPSNFSVKHPLQNGWTIWYDNPGKRSSMANWADQLKKITTIYTVEDFWSIFNNLKPASSLPQGSNYHIFKEHIEPKWEDPTNSRGGKWTVSVPPKNRATALDTMWLFTILECIGETIKSPDDVCGMVVSIRKGGDRVQIWTRDASNETSCRDIGQSLKEALEIPPNVLLGYQSHADSMKKSSSMRNRYEV